MPQSQSFDVLIAGAGILGLWVAREARRRGLRVCIVDAADGLGAGASATPLAVLLPHLPDRTEPKRAFQRDALTGLSDEIALLESETGMATGYNRRGRVMPIRKPTFLAKAQQAKSGALSYWQVAGAPRCEIVPPENGPNIHADDAWLNPSIATLGILYDTMSAAVHAKAYLTALGVACAHNSQIQWQSRMQAFDTARRRAIDADGAPLPSAAAVVISAGFGSFEVLTRALQKTTGDGVKGHAATFRLRSPLHDHDQRPVLYDNGIYVVPLSAESVSVGSTTEYNWDDAEPSEIAAARMIEQACEICPPLHDATLTNLWAGIRPRAATRSPIIGAVPGHDGLYVATGGYKITFGIAHRLAACLVDEILTGAPSPRLPEAFRASELISA